LAQCAAAHEAEEILTEPAVALLAERLTTPLQIEHYLTRALEERYKVGQKPLTPEFIERVLACDLNNLEPHLTRHGYNVKALADLLNARPAEIRPFLAGQLPPNRTHELQQELLAAGLPR
jgi:hypothetical protein